MNKHFLIAATLLATLPAHALTVTQWDFNASNLVPTIGSGTASALGTTESFASGSGSSDPAVTPDQAWSTSSYPAQGTGDKTEGVQFNVSTVGWTNVVISFDNRQSNTASRYLQVQYTIDGSTFADAAGGLFAAAGGGVWNNANAVDLSAVAGVANNASFGFRIVTTFAPSTSAYEAASISSSYGTSGTVRFDMVTVAATAVPEPGSVALLLAGLAAVGFMARRRA